MLTSGVIIATDFNTSKIYIISYPYFRAKMAPTQKGHIARPQIVHFFIQTQVIAHPVGVKVVPHVFFETLASNDSMYSCVL